MLQGLVEVRISDSQYNARRGVSLAGELLKLTVVYRKVGSVIVSVSGEATD